MTSEASEGVRAADARAEPPGHGSEHFVAGEVTEGVVHGLEVVDVAHHEGDGPGPAHPSPQGMVHPIGEQHPVGESGERVVGRLVGELGLPLAEVTDRRLEPPREPGVLHDGEQLADEHERDGGGARRHEHAVEPAAGGRLHDGGRDGEAERQVGEHGLRGRQLPARARALRVRRRGNERRQEDEQIADDVASVEDVSVPIAVRVGEVRVGTVGDREREQPEPHQPELAT